MTRQQAAQIVMELFARFPQATLDKVRLAVWTTDLEDFRPDSARKAITGFLRRERPTFCPSLDQIREAIVVYQREEDRDRLRLPEPQLSDAQITANLKRVRALVDSILGDGEGT